MAEKGIVWVPTMVAYTQTFEYIKENIEKGVSDKTGAGLIEHYTYFKNAAETYRNNFRELYETGVKIVTGSDLIYYGCPVTPVDSEIKYMVNYGMTPLEAIRAATKTGAETLEIDDIIGEIAVGKLGDILIVDGNPLDDICAIENVREVFFSGKSVYVG
jgi:imidazolonepropionase-like amidohydrolase